MSCLALPRSRRIGFGWWLALLLALPLAQSMAAWHEVSHLGGSGESSQPAESAPRDAPALPHGQVCALCMAAAAIDAGGLPAPALALPLVAPAVRLVRVPVAAIAAWMPPAVAVYRSRAPPAAA